MAARFDIVIDSAHPAALARFWADALPGYAIRAYDAAEVARLGRLVALDLDGRALIDCATRAPAASQFGADASTTIEPNYLCGGGQRKRFFDRQDLVELFGDWQIDHLEEKSIMRYAKPKWIWELGVRLCEEGSR